MQLRPYQQAALDAVYDYLFVDDIDYDADLNRTWISFRNAELSSPNGFVVDICPDSIVAGFGNTVAAGSTAFGQLCTATGKNSFAAGFASSAEGDQAIALGWSATAHGAHSIAMGGAYAASEGSCAIGAAVAGTVAYAVGSIANAVVSIYGDRRSQYYYRDQVLIRGIHGELASALITSVSSAPEIGQKAGQEITNAAVDGAKNAGGES